jgi:hypothetical protein
MKPEHTRPFDLAAAKAGAPYCCRDGQEATVLKWDCRDPLWPVVGVYGSEDGCTEWGSNGTYNDGMNDELDLIMIPLGYCEGKPVFVGDELEQRVKDGWVRHNAQASWYRHTIDWKNDMRWARPAPNSPQSTMTYRDLNRLTGRNFIFSSCGGDFGGSIMHIEIEHGGGNAAISELANAAIRHALEAFQVVLPRPPAMTPSDDDPAELAYWRFDARVKGDAEWRGRPQSERDAFKAEYRIAMAEGALP